MDLKALSKRHRDRFASDADFFDWVMMEIQSHMIEIEDCRRERSEEMERKIAGLAALSWLLATANSIDTVTIRKRAEIL